jgi:uncharacterized protein YpmB
MKKIFVMSFVALVAMTMVSCVSLVNKQYRNETPSQVSEIEKVTAMQTFDKVNVEAPVNVILEQTGSNTVRVKGTNEQLEKMTIYVDKDGLTIDLKEYNQGLFDNLKNNFKGVTVFVTVDTLKGIKITGAGDMTVPTALNAEDFNLHITGVGDMNIAQLTCKNLDIKITGAGDVTMGAVNADAVTAKVTGAGNIEMASLVAKSLDNKTTGAGNMVFNNLNVDVVKSHISGAGNVTLSGTVGSHEEKITGVGSVDVSGLK